MHGNWMLYELRVPGKQLRLAQRRAREKTETFRQQYRMRGGIEATNSIVKRVTGLGRLRVRGRPSVTRSALLKVAGWNVLRAATEQNGAEDGLRREAGLSSRSSRTLLSGFGLNLAA